MTFTWVRTATKMYSIRTKWSFRPFLMITYSRILYFFFLLKIGANVKATLFCNLKDIIDISSMVINSLEYDVLNKPNDDCIHVSTCFLNNCQTIKQVYAHYAQYIEHSMSSVMSSQEEKVSFFDVFLLLLSLFVEVPTSSSTFLCLVE
jgi:hypothetical protein